MEISLAKEHFYMYNKVSFKESGCFLMSEDQNTMQRSIMRENLSLSVYHCGHVACTPGYGYGPAMRDHYVIHYIISGCGFVEYNQNGVRIPMQAGSAFLIAPLQTVYYEADQNDPWCYDWVGFNGTEAERLISLTDFSDSPVISLPANARMEKHMSDIQRVMGNTAADEARMTGRLYLLLSRLMKLGEKNHSAGRNGNYNFEKAIRFIMNNYSRHIDVTDIADYLGISRSHLYRLFVKHTGFAPNEYLTRYRINQACSLLRNPDLTIRQIAFSVGFSDQLYFSRVFRRLKKVPPSSYLHDAYQDDTTLLLEQDSFSDNSAAPEKEPAEKPEKQ